MSMSMSMSSMNATATSAVAAATTSAAASGGHSHSMSGMGGENTCKISMLWNWNTIDACFLSSSWHISNNGMFAATCIGVAALVILLEFFRRLGKEYDALLVRQFKRNLALKATTTRSQAIPTSESSEPALITYRATPIQQVIRAALHAVVFGIAYIVMLLAMYYNGYLLLSIFVAAFLGKFFCDWMVVKLPLFAPKADLSGKNIDHQIDEATVCCG